MKGYYRQVIDILKMNGFAFLRMGKGSHEMWAKGSLAVSVPSNCASRHTANGVLKDAGISTKI
jgi:predicted RNA binding protein YcfA (HicA-like mRNA interferase family)